MFSLPDHSCHHRHLQGSVLHGWFPTTVLPCSLVPAYPHAWWPPDEQWGTLYMFYWAAQGVSCSFSYLLHCGCWLWGRWTPLYHFTSTAPLIVYFFTKVYQLLTVPVHILHYIVLDPLSDSILLFRVMAAKGSRVIVLVIHEPSLLSLVGNYGFKMCVVIVQS